MAQSHLADGGAGGEIGTGGFMFLSAHATTIIVINMSNVCCAIFFIIFSKTFSREEPRWSLIETFSLKK
ncbi:MAG: hypothetical protein Q8Q76_08100 [Methylotenera sp.]|nr:hypothetical protein [Methylotenera sp.]